jgi:hypothetical protein
MAMVVLSGRTKKPARIAPVIRSDTKEVMRALLNEVIGAADPARQTAAMILSEIMRTTKTKAAFSMRLKKMESHQSAEVGKELQGLTARYGL